MALTEITAHLDCSFEEALERVPAALATQGFGVLTRIDVKDTLKKKIDVDFRPYTILGACNPRMAHQALSTDLDIGILLPCNVIVFADDTGVTVKAVDPEATLGRTGIEGLGDVAAQVKGMLTAAIQSLNP